MKRDDVDAVRDEIILAALPDVAFDGWSWDMVCAAAEKAGHSEGSALAVFPARVVDVLDGFADLADREMLAALASQNPEDMKVRARIRAGLLARYEFLGPHKEAFRQSLQYWLVPTRKIRAAKITWRTADVLWHWAGDEARDYNRYTKRGFLSGIIASSALFWLNKDEESMDSLEAFIDRRIENVMKFGKFVGRFKRAS